LVGALSGEVVLTAAATPATVAQPETGKVVALTFDDGPDPTWTPQVLRILATEGVPATFCDLGRWASAYPDLVRAEVAQGATLCDHTVDHDTTLDRAPHERVAFEVDRGADMIQAVAGVRPRFYRPPAGILSPDVIATAHGQGLRVLTWSVDPSDYLVPPSDVLLSRILSQVRPGAVILLHDGGGFRANTVGILAPLIDTLRSEGYRFTTPAQETPA
jgi:peptidoglycan/xylan/chitin deacetylase (PgdA/CDA1 family)